MHRLRPYRKSSAPTSPRQGKPPRKPDSSGKATKPCYRCGGEHNSDKCRFREAECRYCHKKGHIASVCRQKQKNTHFKSTHAVTEQPDDSLEEYALTIDCVTTPHSNPLMVTVEMDNTPVKMEVDTGATLSIMSYSTYSSTWPRDSTPEVKPTRAKLRTYTGEAITVRGVVDVTVKYGGQEEDLTLVIVDGDGPTLLGRDWLQNLRLDWATSLRATMVS